MYVLMCEHASSMHAQPIFIRVHAPFMHMFVFINSYERRIQHAYACRDHAQAYGALHEHIGTQKP